VHCFRQRLLLRTEYSGPQKTFQSNKQLKYDGSKIYRSHVFRYGVGYNKILGGGFANFFGSLRQCACLHT